MKPEEQCIAVAEYCGWKTIEHSLFEKTGYAAVHPLGKVYWKDIHPTRELALIRVIPDYLDGGIWDVDEYLPMDLARKFKEFKKTRDSNDRLPSSKRATEEFLRIVGKWKE